MLPPIPLWRVTYLVAEYFVACNSVCLGKRNRRGMSLELCTSASRNFFHTAMLCRNIAVGVGQDQLPHLLAGNTSGNCQDTESHTVFGHVTCHNILQDTLEIGMPHHPSGLFGDWDATSFRAPWRLGCHNILQGTLVGGQHQRVDTLLHARTAHDGLQQ